MTTQDNSGQLSASQQRRNLWRLTLAQALSGANSVVVYATGAIIGDMLAPTPVLATLPISIFVVGMAACILPAGMIARRYGRPVVFLSGAGAGVVAGLLAMWAVMTSAFWLFCLATFCGGAYAAVVLTFRFAAADGVAANHKAQALSLVMAGGIVAGVFGPQLVTWSMGLWPRHMFAATFLCQAIVAALVGGVLTGIKLAPPRQADKSEQRPLSHIALQTKFIAAASCGAVAYMLMNFLMTAAPLAMHHHGHSQVASNLGIQWHVIAMYAPSFFTGKLIRRFGPSNVAMLGLLFIGLSVFVGLEGVDKSHFWAMLILLGLGWNFGFIGASSMVLECHQPQESSRVQSLNDFIVFGLMAIGSFSSGGILNLFGWGTVLEVSLIPLTLATLALLIAKRYRVNAPQRV